MTIDSKAFAMHLRLIPIILFSTVGAVSGQIDNRDQAVPGYIFVKFKMDAITAITQELDVTDVTDMRLRAQLNRIGFIKAQKVFKDATPADTTAIALTGEIVKQIDVSRWYTLRVNPALTVPTIIDSLRLFPGIEAVGPVLGYFPHVVPNDPEFYRQRGLKYGSTGPDIHADGAWDINKGRSDVVVAVVDGGVDYDHIDLDPGDRSRIIQGYDTADEDNDPNDDCVTGWLTGGGFGGHGTAVAGIIGAITNNDEGVAGIMWNTQIMPIKVASTYGPEWFPYGVAFGTPAAPWDIAQGIDYAKNNGAHIINMSLGHTYDGWWDNPLGNPVGEAVWNAYEAGVLLIASMGNENTDDTSYPAAFPRVMGVGASNLNDKRAYYSNYGSHISVVAPGMSNQIYSTTRYNDAYDEFSGTSAAAPMVAGTAGLIISQSIDRGWDLTNDDVHHLLEVSADDIVDLPDGAGVGWDEKTGYGRINAERALQYLEPPYTVTHGSATGGSSQLTWDSHAHTFHGGTGTLAAGKYYGVKQYKVTRSISFPDPYGSVPIVWMRERSTVGWSGANPNRALPWAQIESVTADGATFSTFVYFLKYNLRGQEINEWHPSSPSNVTFAYTVLGAIENLTLENLSISDTKVYTATNSITAGPNFTVETTGDVTFVAGSKITLSPGFHAKEGSDFHAYIDEGLGGGGLPKAATDVVAGGGENGAQTDDDDQAGNEPIPTEFSLSGNYPNPFNPTTTIRFGLPTATNIEFIVYDLLGREVDRLMDRHLDPGYYQVAWRGRDAKGRSLPSGVYIARLVTPEYNKSIKMLLLK